MIDVRALRADPEAVKAAMARRGDPSLLADLDRVLELAKGLQDLAGRRDDLRARIKKVSRDVGTALRGGDTATAERLRAESTELGNQERALDTEYDDISKELDALLLVIPNVPSPLVPDGDSEHDNPVLRSVGATGAYGDHQRVPHWEIGAELGILDLESGAKLSGSMFPLFRGQGAALARALCQLALDHSADVYEEIRPPTLVRTETMVSTGHLPKFDDEAYHIERDDLWGIPTAEVPLTSLGRGEIFDERELPLKLMAYTPCLRREAGSAGRDTRGLLRVHEFDKVELLAYTTPERAMEVHADILARAEWALTQLGLAYRVVEICSGDLGLAHAYSVDLEAYAPGCDQWLEVSSVSWYSDYQARRANLRYRPAEGKGTVVAHTVNGSALAVPRVWAALVETHRQPDGSIAIPQALRRYMRDADSISLDTARLG
jgi:seryl-tRNA synthetase